MEFLEADELRFAYIRKQERDRLQAIDPRGRNISVNGDRVVVAHAGSTEDDFPAKARSIAERISRRQSEVDVELLWQSLSGKQQEMEASELAALFFSESSPETASAVFRALSHDNLFFRRKGSMFIPRTEEQVTAEQTRRRREREHTAFHENASNLVRQLINGNAEITPEAEILLDRIQNWLKYGTGDEAAGILEEITGPAKARDAAYEILLHTGRVDPSADRFLVTAGIEPGFSSQLLEAAEQLSPFIHTSERVDFQARHAFTIDDEDTREVDDALTVERSGDETIVGIHIADVSAFVDKGDLLDNEALRRCSTIYLPSVTVPMFPARLSMELTSLMQGAARPAFTVEVRFDGQGNRTGYRITLSTIFVGKRFSYDEADEALERGSEPLQMLHHLAEKLRDLRAAQGAITFRRPELKIRVHDHDIQIKKIDPNSPSRFLVSEMMILANGLAADFAALNAIPVIYRTQEPREALPAEDPPAVEAIAFEKLRKTFKRSRLSLTPGLHSGLGLTAYTQASSPIRRYADVVVQRQFTSVLRGRPAPHSREELLQILAAAEGAEHEIRGIEDRSTQYWTLEYLRRHRMNTPLSAVVLDAKGSIELEDYYLRAKVAGIGKAQPGDKVRVMIDMIDPSKGDLRLKTSPLASGEDGVRINAKA